MHKVYSFSDYDKHMSLKVDFNLWLVIAYFLRPFILKVSTIQMGFGASEVFDPMSQISIPLMGQYLYLVAILVFISLHGPIFIIKEIYSSFELVNASTFIREAIN